MISVLDDTKNFVSFELLAPFEEAQLDQKGEAHDFDVQFFEKSSHGSCGSARSKEIIDHEDALSWDHIFFVDLQCIRAVLQLVAFADGFVGEFTGLAYWNKPNPKAKSERRPKDKPARLDTHDLADVHLFVVSCQKLDDMAKSFGVGKQGSDIFEEDAGLGEVWDIADIIKNNGRHAREAPLIWGGCMRNALMAGDSGLTKKIATGWKSLTWLSL